MYDFFWGKAPDHLLNIMNSFLKMRALAINIGSNHVKVNCVKILKNKIQNTFCNLVSQFFDKNHFNLYYDLVHCLIKRNLGERIFISEIFYFGLILDQNSGLRFLLLGLLRLLQVRNESKRNPIYGSRFYSAYEKYYKNNRNTK